MEQKYQETYFGSNEESLSIARKLIFVFSIRNYSGSLGKLWMS